jgi:methenyltetrahydromethanopterin cyclohydrolase
MSLDFTAKLAALGLSAFALTACVEETATVSTTPNAAEQACLAAVSRETNNGNVSLLGSQFSEAGTSVQVGVGDNRAPWQCIAYSDGTTAGVQFMGSEGAA